ncbi:MAG: ArdC family protein [Solirubrobacteraceae bacterium]
MTRQRNQISEQERERRRAEQRELVAASVEQLRSSKGWHAWLNARRTFHSYSVGNLLLILSQHETAARVAGFHAWLRLGYCVCRGEHGIRIWAPCPPSRRQLEEWHTAGADPHNKPRTGWRPATVFAQDQVAPLPPPAQPAPLTPPVQKLVGDSHQDLIAPLAQLGAEIGYTVSFTQVDHGDGYCDPARRRIAIATRLEPNGQLATLIPGGGGVFEPSECLRTTARWAGLSLGHLSVLRVGQGFSDRRRGASRVA